MLIPPCACPSWMGPPVRPTIMNKCMCHTVGPEAKSLNPESTSHSPPLPVAPLGMKLYKAVLKPTPRSKNSEAVLRANAVPVLNMLWAASSPPASKMGCMTYRVALLQRSRKVHVLLLAQLLVQLRKSQV
ncbi:hypothetical protein DdX_17601 [Ditylenchus destructor]|uniref:Uncharacterized protein n=1 Tax=Ditylenchus destructor TaxID=166010 RepID=A0AAD4ML49_9BILA|nr:hypothetical protein DdX_17601 [Ditylenchus destructor]